MLNTSQLVVKVRKNDSGVVWNINRPQCSVNTDAARTFGHEARNSRKMLSHVEAKMSRTIPEIDELDGFKFVALERLDQMDKYVKETVQRRHHRQSRIAMKMKAEMETNPTVMTVPVSDPILSSPKPIQIKNSSKKTPILTKHRKRLRKSDKRVIAEKVHGFSFVSAFSLADLDAYDREMAGQLDLSTLAKRKATPPRPPFQVAKKAKIKNSCGTPEQFDEISDFWELATSKVGSSVSTKLHGKAFSKHAGKTPPKHAGKNNKTLSNKLGIDHVNNSNPSVSRSNDAGMPQSKTLSFGHIQPGTNPSNRKFEDALLVRTKSKTKKGEQYPHMQIDYPIPNRRVSSSSESNETVIVISDGHDLEENTYLDVCGVDDESSSAQFIQQSIKRTGEKKGKETEEEEQKSDKSNKGKLNKKKKCKTCCAHPCRIVEARKIGHLWGSKFPSYKVSCVTTCKLHPPGEIMLYPNSTKRGFMDTGIQTNATDIRMHQDFARRFPYQAIAVTSSGPRTLDVPKLKLARVAPELPLSKSEHHRTSEQKRREQMHESFTELRKVINISQAIPDNERASKQWILEHAKKVIGSLEAESILLSAMKKNLQLKNEKLKKRWKELSGKEFHPNLPKVPLEESGQTKLINLYKQYRQNVKKEIPELPREYKNARQELLARRNRLAHPSQEFAKKMLSKTTFVNKISDIALPDKPNDIVVTSKSDQATLDSVSKPSQATCDSTSKPSQFTCATATKSNLVTALIKSSQATSTVTSKGTTTVMSKTTTTVTSKTTSMVTNKPNADIYVNKSSQVTALNQSSTSTSSVLSKSNQGTSVSISNNVTTLNQSSQASCTVTNKSNQGVSVRMSRNVPCLNQSNQSSGTHTVTSQANHCASVSLAKNTTALNKSSEASCTVTSQPSQGTSAGTSSHITAVSKASEIPNTKQSHTLSVSKPSHAVEVGITNHAVPLNNPSEVIAVTKPGHSPFVSKPSHVVAVRIASQATTVNNLSQTLPVRIPSQAPAIPVAVSSQAIPLTRPSTCKPISVNYPNQTTSMRMSTQVSSVNKRHYTPTVAAGIPVPSQTIAVTMSNQPLAMSMTGQVIALNPPIHYISLNKLSQPISTSSPTQWNGVSGVTVPAVNMVPVEELGAVVEVDDTTGQQSDGNHPDHNEIVLLDVAQTISKSASSTVQKQVQPLSLIPTSSCINVTLKSVGSITSNKIFNKKLVPSKPKSPTAHQGGITNHKSTSLPKAAPSQQIEAKGFSHFTQDSSFGQVPEISDTLLAEKFQGGKNATGSANEPRLCVISNVFSLSDTKTVENSNNNQPVTCVTVLNDTLDNVHSFQNELDPGKCDKPDNLKLVRSQVSSNGQMAMHDHNYFRFGVNSPT